MSAIEHCDKLKHRQPLGAPANDPHHAHARSWGANFGGMLRTFGRVLDEKAWQRPARR